MPGQLTYIDTKRVELARALISQPRVLLLDEWLAGLNPTELEAGIALIASLREECEAIIVVEHVMEAIRSLCDRCVVMASGSKIAEGDVETVLNQPAVIEAYLGVTMIKVSNLSVRYGQHVACSDISLQVKPGEIVVILGANGAGKSTLLKAMAGISEGHVEGSITLSGRNILGADANDIVDLGLALVPENRGIFANLSVIENLRLGAYTDRARKRETANLALVHELFPKLVERENQMVRTMSGGERQMVAIGRAIMSAPSILLLDEPSLGLSPLLSKELFGRLKVIKQAGLGILLVEQNAKGSLAIADRGYVLENGRITLEDVAEALQQNSAVQQAYLGASKSRKAVKTSVGAPAAKAANLPRPVDTGPNPTDIAAAAMERFSRDAPAVSPPQTTPQDQSIPTAAAAVTSSSQPTPRAATPAVAVSAPPPSVAPPSPPRHLSRHRRPLPCGAVTR